MSNTGEYEDDFEKSDDDQEKSPKKQTETTTAPPQQQIAPPAPPQQQHDQNQQPIQFTPVPNQQQQRQQQEIVTAPQHQVGVDPNTGAAIMGTERGNGSGGNSASGGIDFSAYGSIGNNQSQPQPQPQPAPYQQQPAPYQQQTSQYQYPQQAQQQQFQQPQYPQQPPQYQQQQQQQFQQPQYQYQQQQPQSQPAPQQQQQQAPLLTTQPAQGFDTSSVHSSNNEAATTVALTSARTDMTGTSTIAASASASSGEPTTARTLPDENQNQKEQQQQKQQPDANLAAAVAAGEKILNEIDQEKQQQQQQQQPPASLDCTVVPSENTNQQQQQQQEEEEGRHEYPPQPEMEGRMKFTCPKCRSVLFGGARLQIQSVALPQCDECTSLAYGEFFYSPPKINPEDTRGMKLKQKKMELLKIQINEKWRRTLSHAQAQLEAAEEYISRQRKDKCDRVHALKEEQQAKKKKKEEQEEKNNNKENNTTSNSNSSKNSEAGGGGEKKKSSSKKKPSATSAAAAASGGEEGSGSGAIFSDSHEPLAFDSTTVSMGSVHGAALASASGDELRKICETEAKRLNVPMLELIQIPGYVDLKGRRLGVKRVGPRYELGFGFSATPLHFATLACRADLVATLLDLGSNPKINAGPSSIHQAKNRNILAPDCMELARANKFDAILSLLENSISNSAEAKFSKVCQAKRDEAMKRIQERNEAEGKPPIHTSPRKSSPNASSSSAAGSGRN